MVLLSLLHEDSALSCILAILTVVICAIEIYLICILTADLLNTDEVSKIRVRKFTEPTYQERAAPPTFGRFNKQPVEQISIPAAKKPTVLTTSGGHKCTVEDRSDIPDPSQQPDAPVSVNYHASRLCNYKCGFCFHTETTSFMLDGENTKRGLKLLKEAGMLKLNIAGGEPFLHPKKLTMMLQYCKEELKIESISIVSNGSKISKEWMAANAQWLDILAISCDSFNSLTNQMIGRGKDGKNVERLRDIAAWCKEYSVKFKINTVVNTYNWNEDMAALIAELAPFRWKVFQCLLVAGENDSPRRKRDARKFLVTDEQWRVFCSRHKHLLCFVPEDNNSMASSYLMLDEFMRFLDKGNGMIKHSESILDVGVVEAMKQVVWDRKSFVERGGIYDWSKEDVKQKPMVGACGTTIDIAELDF
ncbi:radical S-adenosyl methionine domain-containing 2 [Pyrenophora seminiperda CCB06]|uniref:Radical S-adenosyl methionine domain-containing 2 n=1 Tax=Pyrenophora seminiperda CCB06 TaxID=1302712 RepID=A0A3M7M087_9PLEO|nr:radical S-adenosyl methionine domain-containing 2 [Pyrenophora seminiperda CCB06]